MATLASLGFSHPLCHKIFILTVTPTGGKVSVARFLIFGEHPRTKTPNPGYTKTLFQTHDLRRLLWQGGKPNLKSAFFGHGVNSCEDSLLPLVFPAIYEILFLVGFRKLPLTQ